jgi:3-hydroxyacyl-[acyl-carrier-protein] dehydratase
MSRLADAFRADHPAFAGHFPGNPVAPGVLLLARVARAVARACGVAISGAPAVKFLAPLRPGERFEIEFDPPRGNAPVKFRVLRGATLIASGSLRLRRP